MFQPPCRDGAMDWWWDQAQLLWSMVHQPGILYLAGLRWTSPTIVCTQKIESSNQNFTKEGWYHAILSPSVFMCFPCTWNISTWKWNQMIGHRLKNSRCPGGQVLVTVGFLSNILKKDKKLKFRDDFSPFLLLIFPFQRCFAERFCPIFRCRCHIRPTGTACLGV